jgi:protein SCO1/2
MINRNTINIIIPALLLALAILWVTFGSNIFNNGYGLERDKTIKTPTILSTAADYASIEDLNGYVTYLTFGFSHCTGNCPFTLAQFNKLAAILPDDIRLVFVSVDEQRDDLPHLKNFLSRIDPNIIGWKVAETELPQFAEQFDTHFSAKKGAEPEHGSAIQLIDQNGRWVKTYPYLNLNEGAVLKDYLALRQISQTF